MRGWLGDGNVRAQPADPDPMDALRQRWREASVVDGWLSASDWWDPACDAVVEALVGGRCPLAALHRLGHARAGLGCGVEETIDDVVALWRVRTAGEPPVSVVRALASGWADAGLQPVGADSCFDPVSGLFTRAYLEARLAELYRDGRPGHPADRYALIVVDIGQLSPLTGVGAISRIAEALRRTFTAGEALARFASGRAVALCKSGPELADRLSYLEGLLRNPELGDDLFAAIWVESLPRTFAPVKSLLVDLSR